MLHTLLLILKIIGIILAVILGIVILLLAIVLFVPIRYDVAGKCDGTAESLRVKAGATWLLRLFQAELLVKGKKLKWQIRFAWFRKKNAVSFEERKEDKSNETVKTMETVETVDSKDEIPEKSVQVIDEEQEEDSQKNIEHSEDKVEEDSEASETNDGKVKKIIEKIKNTINDLVQKKEKITDFLSDKSHIHAFQKLKKELGILLKRLKPKKINMKVRFGFEDPAVTGKVLGGISILYPFLGDTTEIIPDFEEKILKGSIYIKGKIRIWHLVICLLKLLICKDIRTSYNDIRNFKL